jgi:hypothetical protein
MVPGGSPGKGDLNVPVLLEPLYKIDPSLCRALLLPPPTAAFMLINASKSPEARESLKSQGLLDFLFNGSCIASLLSEAPSPATCAPALKAIRAAHDTFTFSKPPMYRGAREHAIILGSSGLRTKPNSGGGECGPLSFGQALGCPENPVLAAFLRFLSVQQQFFGWKDFIEFPSDEDSAQLPSQVPDEAQKHFMRRLREQLQTGRYWEGADIQGVIMALEGAIAPLVILSVREATKSMEVRWAHLNEFSKLLSTEGVTIPSLAAIAPKVTILIYTEARGTPGEADRVSPHYELGEFAWTSEASPPAPLVPLLPATPKVEAAAAAADAGAASAAAAAKLAKRRAQQLAKMEKADIDQAISEAIALAEWERRAMPSAADTAAQRRVRDALRAVQALDSHSRAELASAQRASEERGGGGASGGGDSDSSSARVSAAVLALGALHHQRQALYEQLGAPFPEPLPQPTALDGPAGGGKGGKTLVLCRAFIPPLTPPPAPFAFPLPLPPL